jgi:hypothetical protein
LLSSAMNLSSFLRSLFLVLFFWYFPWSIIFMILLTFIFSLSSILNYFFRENG